MSEEYANLEVNRVILHANASAYTNADAVPKSYVDQVKSDILGGGLRYPKRNWRLSSG